LTFADIAMAGWTPQERPSQLWYIAGQKLYRVEMRTEPTPHLSEPELDPVLSELLPKSVGGQLLPDGRAFGILKGAEETDPEEIRVVLNWFDELRQKLATGQ
jgi:hypothetical protein